MGQEAETKKAEIVFHEDHNEIGNIFGNFILNIFEF